MKPRERKKPTQAIKLRKFNWRFSVGLGMILMVFLVLTGVWLKQQRPVFFSQTGSESKSDRIQVNGSKIIEAEDLAYPASGLILRTPGYTHSSTMDTIYYHPGTDYAEPEGTLIRSICDGTVIYAGTDPDLGNRVVLDCGQGWQMTYGCLENLRVKTGDVIEANSLIGQVAYFAGEYNETGRTQLHVEVRHQNPAP